MHTKVNGIGVGLYIINIYVGIRIIYLYVIEGLFIILLCIDETECESQKKKLEAVNGVLWISFQIEFFFRMNENNKKWTYRQNTVCLCSYPIYLVRKWMTKTTSSEEDYFLYCLFQHEFIFQEISTTRKIINMFLLAVLQFGCFFFSFLSFLLFYYYYFLFVNKNEFFLTFKIL